MYIHLLQTHSWMRYFVLIALLIVIFTSLRGWLGKRPFEKTDNALSLSLLIFTHIQFLLGLILYFVSSNVQFNAGTMKNDEIRYWTVEHMFGMLIAVVLITVARSTAKRMSLDEAKHKRLFIFNTIALVIIVVVVLLSGRPFFTPTGS